MTKDLKALAREEFERSYRQARMRALEDEVQGFMFYYDNFFETDIESPIEAKLIAELLVARFPYSDFDIDGCNTLSTRLYGAESFSKSGRVFIIPQHEIAGCRVDVALYVGDNVGGWIALAIECDGHDFHARTKEQARRDRARDRAITAAGFVPIRFTGSELYRDAASCVLEIMEIVQQKTEERWHVAGMADMPRARRDLLPAYRARQDEKP